MGDRLLKTGIETPLPNGISGASNPYVGVAPPVISSGVDLRVLNLNLDFVSLVEVKLVGSYTNSGVPVANVNPDIPIKCLPLLGLES